MCPGMSRNETMSLKSNGNSAANSPVSTAECRLSLLRRLLCRRPHLWLLWIRRLGRRRFRVSEPVLHQVKPPPRFFFDECIETGEERSSHDKQRSRQFETFAEANARWLASFRVHCFIGQITSGLLVIRPESAQ